MKEHGEIYEIAKEIYKERIARRVYEEIISLARNNQLPNLFSINSAEFPKDYPFEDVIYWRKNGMDLPNNQCLVGEAIHLENNEFLFVEGREFSEENSFDDLEYLVETPFDLVRRYSAPPKKRDKSKEVPFSSPITDKPENLKEKFE